MNPFEMLVYNLNQLGFFGFLLPWVFIFAVCFGLLVKSKALGDDKRISAVVSIVVGFFVVGFGGTWMATFFTTLFGVGAAVIAGILVLVLFIGMAGIPIDDIAKNKAVLVTLIGVALLVFFIAVGGWWIAIREDTIAIVLVLIVMAAAVALITHK